MIIKFSPQVRLGAINYLFVKAIGDVLYVKYEDREEEYDFTYMGEGELQSVQSENITIEPLFEAKRTEDNLYITLYRPIPATHDESLNFPEDIDTSKYDLSEYDKDPMFAYIKEQEALENLDKEMENPIELPDTPTDEEEDLGESEVTKLTENGYSKEENIDYNPIVSETYEEPEFEPVPDIEVPDPIEPDDDLLKTPEFTDIESALEQAFLEEEERKLQEELARQREQDEVLEAEEEEEEVVVETPTEYPIEGEPIEGEPIEGEPIEEEPIEPTHSDEVVPSEDPDVGEHDYANEEETALEDNTELNNEVDNNG